MLPLPRFLVVAPDKFEDRNAVEVLLGGEVLVEPTVGKAGIAHDLADRNRFKAVPVEQAAGALDDTRAGFLLVLGSVGHGVLLRRPIP